MSTSVGFATSLMTYFHSGSVSWLIVAQIFLIALCVTFLLYMPAEYHQLKADRKRAELAKRIRTMS